MGSSATGAIGADGRRRGLVLVEDGKRLEFESVGAAFDYLAPRVGHHHPQPCTVYGAKKDFLKLRYRLVEELDAVIGRETTVASRWMAEATTWGDYFEAKDARGDAASRFDIKATWLTYAGQTR